MKTKKQKLVIQRSKVRGFRKSHALFLELACVGTIIETPDSVNGKVKSTYLDLFSTMVKSPTAPS